jgi:hypothetical protein
MTASGNPIRFLQRKITILAEALYLSGAIKKNSPTELARHLKLNYSRLQKAWSLGTITDDLAKPLAIAGKFELTDRAWCGVDKGELPPQEGADPDTAEKFRDMVHRMLGIGAHSRQIRSARPRLSDPDLLNFGIEATGQRTRDEVGIPVFLTSVVETGVHSGVVFGFKSIRLKFCEFSKESSTVATERLGSKENTPIGDAFISSRGTDFNPEFFLHAEKGKILKGQYSTLESPLCNFIDTRIGEQFEADMSVRHTDGMIVKANGTELDNPTKLRIVELLFTKRIAGEPDRNGWICLGRQTLSVHPGGI